MPRASERTAAAQRKDLFKNTFLQIREKKSAPE
jgi:hypothetical protein